MERKCIKLIVRINMSETVLELEPLDSAYAPIPTEVNDKLRTAILNVIYEYKDKLLNG
jgi:hypothetical protein